MKPPLFSRCIPTALLALLWSMLIAPSAALGQFTFMTNNDTLTVSGYTGPGGVVVIPSTTNGLTVRGVGDHAFESLSTLRSIEIPSSVTNIGANAFASCRALTNAALGDSIVAIGDRAFSQCGGLTEIVVPSTTRFIGGAAFASCSGLTNVIVPESVTHIGAQSFYFCSNLRAISVEPLNAAYSSLDGVLFDHGRTELLQYPAGRTGTYTIPATVTNVGACAFMQCDKLNGVAIPPSVTRIGYYAFYYCAGLAGVVLPEGLATIDSLAFCGCTGVTNFSIPASVSSIGYQAFSDCRRSEAITVPEANLYYCSIGGVLLSRDGRSVIQCPAGKTGSYTVPSTVTEIGASAFWGCGDLTEITIPNSVAGIGDFAFCACTGLNELTMPESVLQLGQYAFDACTNLVGVYFKGDAPAAGYQLFYYVDNVTAYYLPGTRGWGNTYADRPTAWWVLLNPIILTRINFGVRLNGFGLLTSWATNASIVVEACTNLNDARWVPLTTNTLSYGTNYFSDPAWTNNPSRFYRIRRP